MPGFKLDWYAGASAQVEVFSPSAAEEIMYKFKYTPPFRSTIRPPVEDIRIGKGELDPINQGLDKLITTIDQRSPAHKAQPQTGNQEDPLRGIEDLGQQLLSLIIPQYVENDLKDEGLFLEIGMDEALLEYPWELMHDGENFLCLKHSIGRFVNGSMGIPNMQRPLPSVGFSQDKLSILIISVPNPQPRQNPGQDSTEYEKLPSAEDENEAICEILDGHDDIEIEILRDKDATYSKVFKAFRDKPYHIIHYNGHAHYNEKAPYMSGLVLYDRDISTGSIKNFLVKSPPILIFANACDTAKTGKWKERYDVYDLARSFLETGAYLLGSRRKINDTAAAVFAKKFYKSLLIEGKPLGSSILDARKHCKEKESSDNLTWASYILYGDPRICFRRL